LRIKTLEVAIDQKEEYPILSSASKLRLIEEIAPLRILVKRAQKDDKKHIIGLRIDKTLDIMQDTHH